MHYAILCVVFSLVEVLGCHCKDMEDDRSLYTNVVRISFKGVKTLKFESVEIKPNSRGNVKNPSGELKDADDKKKGKDVLENFKDVIYQIPLSRDESSITLRFFYKKDPNNKSTSQKESEEIVIYYHKTDVLVSPNCGIKQCYIIDRVTTSFESATILVPDGKVIDSSQKTNHVEILY